jgi:hypothetical protein
MFNNGTIHINVTLPTRLGWNRLPLFRRNFLEQHRRLARLIQWIEPLWIAAYGSPDPFFEAAPHEGHWFAAGSQRLAVSRYIGVGTFDTDQMPVGKILQIRRADAGPIPWYDRLHTRMAYEPLDVIGLDINYNKHWAHGLEIRIFDQMPIACLRSVMLDIVVLMDIAMDRRSPIAANPRGDLIWQTAAELSIYEGSRWNPPPDYLTSLCAACGITNADIGKEPLTATQALQWFQRISIPHHGFCWNKMVAPKNLKTSSSCLGKFCC